MGGRQLLKRGQVNRVAREQVAQCGQRGLVSCGVGYGAA
jgi:hypothetical protein